MKNVSLCHRKCMEIFSGKILILLFIGPKKMSVIFVQSTKIHQMPKKRLLRDELEMHIDRKEKARLTKAEHKEKCKSDKTIAAIAFDLEQVLLCPKLNVSSLYYKRKLSVYNLTTYNLDDRSVNCYLWHEAVGGRASSEIASCINNFIQSLSQSVRHLVMFSGTCGGQNQATHRWH